MKLQQVMSFLRLWGWLVLLGTAVAAATAYFTSQTITPVYEATATWLVDEPVKYDGDAAARSTAETFAVMATTRSVLAETTERLNLVSDLDKLATMVTAVTPANTNIIHIHVEDSDPDRAAQIANTIGMVLADQHAARESERFAAPRTNWQRQIDDNLAEIETLQSQLAADAVTDRARLESSLAEAQIRYDNAFSQLNALLAQEAAETTVITLAESAQAATAPIRPRVGMAVIWAALTGALTTLVVAGFAGRVRDEEAGGAETAVTPTLHPEASND